MSAQPSPSVEQMFQQLLAASARTDSRLDSVESSVREADKWSSTVNTRLDRMENAQFRSSTISLPPHLADEFCWTHPDKYATLCQNEDSVSHLLDKAAAWVRRQAALGNCEPKTVERYLEEVGRYGRFIIPLLGSPGSVRASAEAIGVYKAYRDAVTFVGIRVRDGPAEASISYDSLRGSGASIEFVKMLTDGAARRSKTGKASGE